MVADRNGDDNNLLNNFRKVKDFIYGFIAFLDKDIRPYIKRYKENKPKGRCCICGKKATHRHWSIMGQIPYDVCEYHFKNSYPAMGFSSKYGPNCMGLIDSNTNEPLDFKQ